MLYKDPFNSLDLPERPFCTYSVCCTAVCQPLDVFILFRYSGWDIVAGELVHKEEQLPGRILNMQSEAG